MTKFASANAAFAAMRLMLVLALVALSPARAAEGSWVGATNSKLRLFGGTAKAAGGEELMAGVQLRMDDGWKTYWRNPGDSGVPPQFDWSGSTNLKEAKVLYPAPHRFTDAGGTAVGYSGEVIFPVELTPERPGEPIELKLAFDFGLCKSLCIPNQAKLSLKLAPGAALSGADAKLLNAALNRVPHPVAPDALPAIGKIEAKFDIEKPSIVIEALYPPDAAGSDLFVDIADGTYVPVPNALGPLADGRQSFTVNFMSKDEAKEIKGKTLVLTLVTDRGSRETSWKAE
ncbi:MAG TPA: protein-disulfide reductase DsbD domain-containing protein [Methyloceanibacter sp.]|nr:protein-disulfide reductase DsbD domain-containing protein [Methyloceanibacter sp.]